MNNPREVEDDERKRRIQEEVTTCSLEMSTLNECLQMKHPNEECLGDVPDQLLFDLLINSINHQVEMAKASGEEEEDIQDDKDDEEVEEDTGDADVVDACDEAQNKICALASQCPICHDETLVYAECSNRRSMTRRLRRKITQSSSSSSGLLRSRFMITDSIFESSYSSSSSSSSSSSCLFDLSFCPSDDRFSSNEPTTTVISFDPFPNGTVVVGNNNNDTYDIINGTLGNFSSSMNGTDDGINSTGASKSGGRRLLLATIIVAAIFLLDFILEKLQKRYNPNGRHIQPNASNPETAATTPTNRNNRGGRNNEEEAEAEEEVDDLERPMEQLFMGRSGQPDAPLPPIPDDSITRMPSTDTITASLGHDERNYSKQTNNNNNTRSSHEGNNTTKNNNGKLSPVSSKTNNSNNEQHRISLSDLATVPEIAAKNDTVSNDSHHTEDSSTAATAAATAHDFSDLASLQEIVAARKNAAKTKETGGDAAASMMMTDGGDITNVDVDPNDKNNDRGGGHGNNNDPLKMRDDDDDDEEDESKHENKNYTARHTSVDFLGRVIGSLEETETPKVANRSSITDKIDMGGFDEYGSDFEDNSNNSIHFQHIGGDNNDDEGSNSNRLKSPPKLFAPNTETQTNNTIPTSECVSNNNNNENDTYGGWLQPVASSFDGGDTDDDNKEDSSKDGRNNNNNNHHHNSTFVVDNSEMLQHLQDLKTNTRQLESWVELNKENSSIELQSNS